MKASAFVVGASDGAGAELQALAHSIGFTPVEAFRGLRRAERQSEATPLLFFLCAGVPDVKALKPMADAIRFSASLKLRFSPLIYLAHNLSLPTIRQCIGMGFDDVIALPCAGGDLVTRLRRQIGVRHTYFESTTYFGPDRRNRGETRTERPDTTGEGAHRRIEIIRNPETGVDVVSDDTQFVI